MIGIVFLYEWIDEHGETESFIVLPISSECNDFFDMKGTKLSVWDGEDAIALLKDYAEGGDE
jgi:hypothetical protein